MKTKEKLKRELQIKIREKMLQEAEMWARDGISLMRKDRIDAIDSLRMAIHRLEQAF